MLSFTKFLTTVTVPQKGTYNPATGIEETLLTIIDNKKMAIENIPGQKVYAITGEQQTNAQAYYIMYLELGDPQIPQNADVKWEMHGVKYAGKAKFTKPMSEIVLNRNREVYIVSNNQ